MPQSNEWYDLYRTSKDCTEVGLRTFTPNQLLVNYLWTSCFYTIVIGNAVYLCKSVNLPQ